MKENRRVVPGDRVVVAGAGGGVGRHVVRALVDAGCEVVGIDRRKFDEIPALDTLLRVDELEWIVADISTDDLDELCEGAAAVVNAAAEVGLSESYEELAPTNVIGLGRLWDAACKAGCEHLIHVSAGALYRPGRGLRTEDDELAPENDYEQSKADAEAVLPPVAKSTHWTILRPAHVYGPHCTSMASGLVTLPPILRNFARYQPAFTGGTRTNWCHVEDVAAATLALLGKPAAYERVFNVADDTPLGFGEVMTSVTEAYGLEIGPFIPFPSPTVLVAFSPVVDRDYVTGVIRTVLRQLWNRIADRYQLDTPLRPRIDRNALFYVAEDTVLDNSALKALGWTPKWSSFTEGIVETVKWYQKVGWVPQYDAAPLEVHDSSRGFGFKQEITGAWIHPKTGQRNPMTLSLEVEFQRVQTTLPGIVNGMIWAEELADAAALEGTIELAIVGRQLSYEFGFRSTDGEVHRGEISARFNPLKPLSSMSDLTGTLSNSLGETVGELDLSLELAEQLVPMLLSFRLS